MSICNFVSVNPLVNACLPVEKTTKVQNIAALTYFIDE